MSRSRIFAVVLFVAIVAQYARGVGGAFVLDDRTFFIENEDLTSLGLAGAATVFVRPTNAWGDFQPVRDLLFLVEYQAFGRQPAGYHVVSIVLYAVACLLVFALAKALQAGAGRTEEGAGSGSDWTPMAVALLFAAHPTHVETVSYVCGQKELLSGVFSLGSLLLFAKALGGGGRRGWAIAGGVVCYALAILSKQTAIMLAVVVPLLYLVADRATRPPWLGLALLWGAVQVPAALWMAKSREAFEALWGTTSALGAGQPLERLPRAVKILGAHTRLAVWPHPLSFGYPFDGSVSVDPNLLGGLVAIVVIGGLAWWFRRERVVLLGLAVFVLFLVPVLQLHGSLNNASIYDRYLFLPTFGLAIVVERVARAAFLEWRTSGRGYLATAGALSLAGALATIAYVPAFASNVAVTRNGYERHPGWSRPAFELAYALVEAGRLAEARTLVTTEPTLQAPAWVRPYYEGWIRLAEGDAAGAIPALRWASALAAAGGFYPFPSVPLGRALLATGERVEAVAELRRTLDFPIYQPLEVLHARALLREVYEGTARGSGPIE